MQVPSILRGARAAVTFLTRIPVGGFPYRDSDWQWATAWFPAIGAALGALYATVFCRTLGAGELVAAALVVAAALLVTGAFHEDGLADTADALGGAYQRERIFAILKDSRVGAFGAAALAIAIVLRVVLVARLAPIAAWALVFAESLSRLGPVWMMTAAPYVTADDAAKSRLIARASPRQAWFASMWPIAIGVAGLQCGAWSDDTLYWVGAVNVAAVLYLLAKFRSRAGGITGDFLGASQQVLLCATLLTLALCRGM